MNIFVFLIFAFVAPAGAIAQSKADTPDILPTKGEVPTLRLDQHLFSNSMRLSIKDSIPMQSAIHNQTAAYAMTTTLSTKPFNLWNGTDITVYGETDRILGLMDEAKGMVSFHHYFNHLHFSASAMANKYWMPWQKQLYTQYGFGGTLGYDLTNTVSLHAFGFYYAGNPLVSPAFSPYISTTSFGGYADIRISERVGTNVGACHYINPMNGHWTTEPIATPYLRISKRSKIELPLGGLLKTAIWGDCDNPLRFRPKPLPQPKEK